MVLRKSLNTFIESRIPIASTHRDIEAWTEAAKQAFSPFVRRKRVLWNWREIFRTELVNLTPITEDPTLSAALLEAVRLCRKAIYASPSKAYAHQIAMFSETAIADYRWLNLCASIKIMDADTDLADRAAQHLASIGTFSEGCIKPRVQYLFGFAYYLTEGVYPTRSSDFGTCIANWPFGQAPTLKKLYSDPIFGVPISQWRNIAAHKDYRRTGANLFEASYGRANPRTIHFSFEELESVLVWAKNLLSVSRMANVIIDIEFMPELKREGLSEPDVRIDARMISLAHNLRMVGFTYVVERNEHGKLALVFTDDLKRNARDAIIHLSQALTQLALAASSDVALRDEITEVGVDLCTKNKKVYASAHVSIDAALRHMDHKLTQQQYIHQIQFTFAPSKQTRS